MAIDACAECQSLWNLYRGCVSQIRGLREAAEVALHSYDHEKAETLSDRVGFAGGEICGLAPSADGTPARLPSAVGQIGFQGETKR